MTDMHSNIIGDVASRLVGLVEERKKLGGVELLGLPTGFSLVDKYTGGMQPDQMWIVAARTGGGKTSWALDCALSALRHDPSRSVLFYSLEMSALSLVNRLFARMTGIASGRIIRGKVDEDELEQVRLAAEELADLKLHLVDSTATSEDITTHALGIAEQEDVSLVVVDYLQLLTDRIGSSETERVGEISRRVRALARPDYLNAPVLALSQLNRASQTSEDKVPHLHHLKNSSNLEQDANVVLLLHRPAIENQTKGAKQQEVETDAQIIIAKNRDGMMGATEAQFIPRLTAWRQ